MERLAYDCWLQICKDGPGDMSSRAGLGEEGVEGVVGHADGSVIRNLAVWLYSVLHAVELPAGVAHLDAGLADVDGDDLAHFGGPY